MALEYEIGPIRPPSEESSLLLRVTRNCPWNRCEFCAVYKGKKFSNRPVRDLQNDIDTIRRIVEVLEERCSREGIEGAPGLRELASFFPDEMRCGSFRNVATWVSAGMESVFFQDANSLIVKTPGLLEILSALKRAFPSIVRVTAYARSSTLVRKSVSELDELLHAGLNRIHVGLESGSDAVLVHVKKGCTAEQHIRGGRNVRDAGIELSGYIMPGLGGRPLSDGHARETARVLNEIDPDFIRVRSCLLLPGTVLYDRWKAGGFEPLSDEEIVRELRILIQGLEGISSCVVSDHVFNLVRDVEGRLPGDKDRLLAVIDCFFALSPEERFLFRVGARGGVVRPLGAFQDAGLRGEAEKIKQGLESMDEAEREEALYNLTLGFILKKFREHSFPAQSDGSGTGEGRT